MIKIYHNARCSKSREGLCFIENLNQPFEVINYLENPLTYNELKDIITILGIKPIELVRTKETIWKENFKDQNLTDEAIIQAMVDHPKLIERPIVINNKKAVVARPAEKIAEIL